MKIHVGEVVYEVDGTGSESYPTEASVMLAVSIYTVAHGSGQGICIVIISLVYSSCNSRHIY
jgi:hypothetical protein